MTQMCKHDQSWPVCLVLLKGQGITCEQGRVVHTLGS